MKIPVFLPSALMGTFTLPIDFTEEVVGSVHTSVEDIVASPLGPGKDVITLPAA